MSPKFCPDCWYYVEKTFMWSSKQHKNSITGKRVLSLNRARSPNWRPKKKHVHFNYVLCNVPRKRIQYKTNMIHNADIYDSRWTMSRSPEIPAKKLYDPNSLPIPWQTGHCSLSNIKTLTMPCPSQRQQIRPPMRGSPGCTTSAPWGAFAVQCTWGAGCDVRCNWAVLVLYRPLIVWLEDASLEINDRWGGLKAGSGCWCRDILDIFDEEDELELYFCE